MDNAVAAFLADIRMQAEDHPLVPSGGVLRLLAAVDVALLLPAEWRRESEALRDAAGKVWEYAPDAAGVRLKHAYAAGYAECAKALEAAITKALNGDTDVS